MALDPLESPVVVDGLLTDEKLAQLLALRTEYPELDYKDTIDLSTTEGKVELAKDVGAMQVRGGYIVLGVDNTGVPTGGLDGVDLRPFDEANLTPMLLQWLPEPLELRSRVTKRDDQAVVLIYVGRHSSGCAFFRADGTYQKDGKEVVRFRAGDALWRDGTRSVRLSQQGFEEIMERRITDAKTDWLAEQHEIRRRERADLEAAYEGRRRTEGPLGAVSLDLDGEQLSLAVLELLRSNDTIALRHLLIDAVDRARRLLEREDWEAELGELLDKLACLAAMLLDYQEDDWFDRIISVLAQIYELPLEGDDPVRFGYAPSIDPGEMAPRVWLAVIERVFGLGALAVRRQNWRAVRTLTLQRPNRLGDYYQNWLRHALTMASRAQHLQERRPDDQTVEISLLNLARNTVARLGCLRRDGLTPDDDEVITSLAQFDVLSNIVAIDDAASIQGRIFYPNFARFRQSRIQPIIERLLSDRQMRRVLFTGDDDDLALALNAIGDSAHQEGLRFDGFETWDRTPVGTFIAKNVPE